MSGWTEGIFSATETGSYRAWQVDHNADDSKAPVVKREDVEQALAEDGEAQIPNG